MKKKYLIIISTCLILALGYLTYKQLNPRYVEASASINYLENFSELEETSDLIVKVTATGNHDTYMERDENNMPYIGYTATTVKINKIYKSPEGFLNKDLKVEEPYWAYTSPIGEKIVICIGDYLPMKSENKYILFLTRKSDGNYELNLSAQGKYLLNEKLSKIDSIDSYTPEDFEMGHIIYNYKEFYKEAIKKYK